MRSFLAASFLIISTGLMAQLGRESACDTTVFDHHYTLCIKNRTGRYIAFGNKNEKGERHGWWCELNGDGAERNEGQYANGIPVDEWWIGCCDIWRYDEKGNILSKGRASRSNKTF
jgi:hypothetical protein